MMLGLVAVLFLALGVMAATRSAADEIRAVSEMLREIKANGDEMKLDLSGILDAVAGLKEQEEKVQSVLGSVVTAVTTEIQTVEDVISKLQEPGISQADLDGIRDTLLASKGNLTNVTNVLQAEADQLQAETEKLNPPPPPSTPVNAPPASSPDASEAPTVTDIPVAPSSADLDAAAADAQAAAATASSDGGQQQHVQEPIHGA